MTTYKVLFHQSMSSIKGRLPSKDVLHQVKSICKIPDLLFTSFWYIFIGVLLVHLVFVLLVLVLLVLLVFLALVLLVPFLLVLVTGGKQRHLQVCTCPRSLTKDTILYGYVVAKCQATSRRSWTLDNVSSRGPRYGHHMSA